MSENAHDGIPAQPNDDERPEVETPRAEEAQVEAAQVEAAQADSSHATAPIEDPLALPEPDGSATPADDAGEAGAGEASTEPGDGPVAAPSTPPAAPAGPADGEDVPEAPESPAEPTEPAAPTEPQVPAAPAAPTAPDAPTTPAEPQVPAAPTAPADGPRSDAPHPGAPRPGAPRPGAPRPGAPRPGAPRPGAPRPGGGPAATPPAGSPGPEAAPPAAAPVAPPAALDPQAAAAAREFGRVDDEGNVYVREGEAERRVGQVPGASAEDAMELYVRRYLDLEAQVALLETRAGTATLKDVEKSLGALTEALTEPAAVGDLASLGSRREAAASVIAERQERAALARAEAKASALTERETLVTEAETIAAQDPSRTQWKQSGERLRELLSSWQQAQKSGPRLDRPAEDALWTRFSHARTTFDRHRRQFFSELDARQGETKAVKEKLIARAEELSTSTDWGATSGEYRSLMDEWKAAGRGSRKADDALWARFRDAQQKFFDARTAANAQIDAEYGENLKVKEQILTEAEALVPVKNLDRTKATLRDLQDRWESAGKVPRADVQRVEGRMRKVEQAIRDAEQVQWQRTDPEMQARASGMAAQLEASIGQLEAELAAARDKGDASAVSRAEDALTARRAWLDQVRAAQD